MKLYYTIIGMLFFGYFGLAQIDQTIIQGKVVNWPTDSIYLQTIPFHSPHSSKLISKKISNQNTFKFEFKDIEKAFTIQLFTSRKEAEFNKKEIIFNNLNKEHYIRHCVKYYTYGKATLLVEPHKILEIDLTYNQAIVKLQPAKAKQYKKVGIPVSKENTIHQTSALGLIFYGPDKFQHEYYQNSFELDKIVERRLEIYKNMPLNKAIEGYKKIVSKLLNDLENEKGKLTSNFYNYIRAEIEFGARNQFLRFLMLDKKEEMDTFFSKEIPAEIMTLVSFDKTKVNHSTLISEEFNNFSEMYLNFLISIKHQKLIINEDFNREKIKTAIRNLPKASVYYYLANHLLQTNRKDLMQIIKNEAAVEELITKTITKYPNGELNMKLIEKYDL